MLQGNLGHHPCCQTIAEQISPAVLPSAQFAEKVNALSAEFSRRFADFEAQKRTFELHSNPFAIDVEGALTRLQMELIDSNVMKCSNGGASRFSCFLPTTMPQLRTQAAEMLSMLGISYLPQVYLNSRSTIFAHHVLREKAKNTTISALVDNLPLIPTFIHFAF